MSRKHVVGIQKKTALFQKNIIERKSEVVTKFGTRGKKSDYYEFTLAQAFKVRSKKIKEMPRCEGSGWEERLKKN